MKCRTCGTTLSAGALLCGECGTSAIAPRPTLGDTARHDRKALLDAIVREQRRTAALQQPAPAQPTPEHPPRHAAPPPAARRTGSLFSLVFSTGESIRVSGDGLVGRNPAPAPGERFDYLVQVVDPERSVSKTHLAFGVDEGELWVADRGSSNGTRVGLDLVDPRELVAGERVRVPRGTRVGIGDQWFDVH
ncbi:FHA domain-containing protein [Herbiconiux sp. CPCC 203407]|uniref:FHA domain-containing protein n=1 Tax=Herbiconiux oxytropis TaxID=2970915 RepID=A0AA42BTG9_9MICO|nr:FHA domain-containing protein [Herbiconiux oxytropis]MCS5722591.1 FHA domain-containing protein [Herbiconiux oxytropis]MCS5726395.1 FHA domain-containing protein [Herbiconiux oxytropis]